jgi:hypothetical protein
VGLAGALCVGINPQLPFPLDTRHQVALLSDQDPGRTPELVQVLSDLCSLGARFARCHALRADDFPQMALKLFEQVFHRPDDLGRLGLQAREVLLVHAALPFCLDIAFRRT